MSAHESQPIMFLTAQADLLLPPQNNESIVEAALIVQGVTSPLVLQYRYDLSRRSIDGSHEYRLNAALNTGYLGTYEWDSEDPHVGWTVAPPYYGDETDYTIQLDDSRVENLIAELGRAMPFNPVTHAIGHNYLFRTDRVVPRNRRSIALNWALFGRYLR